MKRPMDMLNQELSAMGLPMLTREGGELLYRGVDFGDSVIGEDGLLSLSGSSETGGVTRYFSQLGGRAPEILLHEPGAVDLSGAHSVFFNHNPDRIVGPIREAKLDVETRRTRFRTDFDDTEEGRTAKTRVNNKSLRGASIGYRVLEYRFVQAGETWRGWQGPAAVATRWRVYEVSLTPIPADDTVGVGRNLHGGIEPMNEQQRRRLRELLAVRGTMTEEQRSELNTLLETQERSLGAGESQTTTAGASTTVDAAPAVQQARATTQDQTTTAAPQQRAEPTIVNAHAQVGVEARASEIDTICTLAGLSAEETLGHIRGNQSVDQVRSQILAQRQSAQGATGGTQQRAIQNLRGDDSHDKFFRGVTSAILMRSNVRIPDAERESAESFRFLGMGDIARQFMSIRGRSVPMNLPKSSVIMMALEQRSDGLTMLQGNFNLRSGSVSPMVSGDFSNLLSNVQNKVLYTGWQEAPTTYQQWCKIGSLPDFKTADLVKLSGLNNLDEVHGKTGPVQVLTLDDDKESRALRKFSNYIDFSFEALVNDDLGALVDTSMKAGIAGRRTVNNIVYYIVNNGEDSVLMSDNGYLWNATAVTTAGGHANYATTGSALSAETLDAGVTAMSIQTDPKGNVLNIAPRFILIPRALSFKTKILLDSAGNPTASLNSAVANPNQGIVTPIVDAEMQIGAGGSATNWALAGDPNMNPLVQVDFLNGFEAPLVTEQDTGNHLSRRWQVSVFASAKAVDWRNGYRATGQA